LPILVVVEEINDDECLHLRGDRTLFVGNKGVIVAFPKLGPRRAAPSKKYVPIPLAEVVNIFPDFGLMHWAQCLIRG
jgi:hypothetical protein